jgi:hypothetical protein
MNQNDVITQEYVESLLQKIKVLEDNLEGCKLVNRTNYDKIQELAKRNTELNDSVESYRASFTSKCREISRLRAANNELVDEKVRLKKDLDKQLVSSSSSNVTLEDRVHKLEHHVNCLLQNLAARTGGEIYTIPTKQSGMWTKQSETSWPYPKVTYTTTSSSSNVLKKAMEPAVKRLFDSITVVPDAFLPENVILITNLETNGNSSSEG